MYGYEQKKFRITKIVESDGEDGTIALGITAIEYDEDVYDESGLIRTERNKKTGIVPKSMNAALSASDGAAAIRDIQSSLEDKVAAYATFISGISTGDLQAGFNAYCGNPNWGQDYPGLISGVTSAASVAFTLSSEYKILVITCQSPLSNFSYKVNINGTIENRSGVFAYVPTQWELKANGSTLSITTGDWGTQSVIFNIPDAPAGDYIISLTPLLTYDFNQTGTYAVRPYAHNILPQSSGAGFTFTILAYKDA